MKRSFYPAILALIIGLSAPSIYAGQDKNAHSSKDPIQISILDNSGKRILGTVTTKRLKIYAVIKDKIRNKKTLYQEGDYIDNEYKIVSIYDNNIVISPYNKKDKKIFLKAGIPYKGIELVETPMLNTFEYRYRITKEKLRRPDERFELVEVKGYKAVLERIYKEPPPSRNKALSRRYVKEKDERSIDEIFLNQLKMKKMGEDVWIIDGKSVSMPVVNDTAKALIDVAKRVKVAGLGKGSPKLQFTSKVAAAVLDRDGLSVDELNPELSQKAGLMKGDIIKAVNGKHVSNIIDLIFLFLDIKNDNISEVNVDILRGNKPRRLIYLIT